MVVQSSQKDDKLAPWHLEISAETSHFQRNTKQFDFMKVKFMASFMSEYVIYIYIYIAYKIHKPVK
jgi:hypothetical protein